MLPRRVIKYDSMVNAGGKCLYVTGLYQSGMSVYSDRKEDLASVHECRNLMSLFMGGPWKWKLTVNYCYFYKGAGKQ